MRKLMAVFLAVMSMVCTTSSLAAVSDGKIDSQPRNDITAFETVETNTAKMPAFRAGDIITFDVSGLTEENFLTVISYKLGQSNGLNNETIQYINQYKIDAQTKTIEYVVRKATQDGIYKLSLNGNDEGETINFYYKVGNPAVSMVVGDSTSYKIMEEYQSGGMTKYAIGFVGKATIGSTDVSFKDVGVAELGFTFTANGKTITQKLTKEQFDAIEAAQMYVETDGSVSFVYGITIYGIESLNEANAIVAEAYSLDN